MKFFKIVYEVEGGKRTDEIYIWANTITKAIQEFITTEIETYGIKVIYTKYAIKKIECK